MTHAGDTGGVCVYIHSQLHRLGVSNGNYLSITFDGNSISDLHYPFEGWLSLDAIN